MATTEEVLTQIGSILKTKERLREKLVKHGANVPESAAFSLYPNFIDGIENLQSGGASGKPSVTAPFAVPDVSDFGGGLTCKQAYTEGGAASLYPETADFPEEPTFIVESQEDFMMWFNAVEDYDYEVVGIKAGVYALGASSFALNNSATKRIYGQNGAVITYSGGDFALFYTSARMSEDYSIKNIKLKITGGDGRAIRNTHTVNHCEVLESKAADTIQSILSFSHCFIINNNSGLDAVVTSTLELNNITVYSQNNKRAFYNTGDLTRCFAMGCYTYAGIEIQSNADHCYVMSIIGADNTTVYGIKAGNVTDSFVRRVRVYGSTSKGYGIYAANTARGSRVVEMVCGGAVGVTAAVINHNAVVSIYGETAVTGMSARAAGGSITDNAVYNITGARRTKPSDVFGYLYDFTTGDAVITGNYLGSLNANTNPLGADGNVYGVCVRAVTAAYSVDISGNFIGAVENYGKTAAVCYGIYDGSVHDSKHAVKQNTIFSVRGNGGNAYGVYGRSAIEDNQIDRVAGTGTGTGYDAPKVYGVFCEVDGCGVTGNKIRAVTCKAGTGAFAYGVYTTNNGVITGNTIGDVAGSGATYGVYTGNNGVITGNTIGDVAGGGATCGVYAGATCTIEGNTTGDVAGGGATYGVYAGATCTIEGNTTGDVAGGGATYGVYAGGTCTIEGNTIGGVTSFLTSATGIFCSINCIITNNVIGNITVNAEAAAAFGICDNTGYSSGYWGKIIDNTIGDILAIGRNGEDTAGGSAASAYGIKGSNFSVITGNFINSVTAKGGNGNAGAAASAYGIQSQNRKSLVSGNIVTVSAVGGVNDAGTTRAAGTVYGYQCMSNSETPAAAKDNNTLGLGHGNTVYAFYGMHYLTNSRITDKWGGVYASSSTYYHGCSANAAMNAAPAYTEAGGWNEMYDPYRNMAAV